MYLRPDNKNQNNSNNGNNIINESMNTLKEADIGHAPPKSENASDKSYNNSSQGNNKTNESINTVYEVDTGHAPSIPENASDKIYNAIVRIEKENGEIGTGFFMKIKVNNKNSNFLFTCHHVITNEDINSKKSIHIFFGKKNEEINKEIKLDINERYIRWFIEEDVTMIEILQSDNILDEKYLSPDLNYKNEEGYKTYIDNSIYLAGYPHDNINEKESLYFQEK